jgi:hypothetical protein
MVLNVRPTHSNDDGSTTSASEDDEDDEDEEDADELTMDLHAKDKEGGLKRLRVDRLLETILQDAQTRLFFKAQAVLHADVRGFVPQPEDLDYPAKLLGIPIRRRTCPQLLIAIR